MKPDTQSRMYAEMVGDGGEFPSGGLSAGLMTFTRLTRGFLKLRFPHADSVEDVPKRWVWRGVSFRGGLSAGLMTFTLRTVCPPRYSAQREWLFKIDIYIGFGQIGGIWCCKIGR